MDEDILAAFEGNETAFKEPEEAKEKFDYWGDPEVTPVKIDVSKLTVKSRSFTICVYNRREPISDELQEKLIKIASVLISKGFTFRHTGDVNDTVQTKIMGIEGVKVESFLPWKKFNPDIEAPTLSKPHPDAYHIAAYAHRGFKKLPNSVRTILARDVHAMLGKGLNEPSSVLIGYSADGAEALVRGLDYTVTGNLAFYLKLAEDSNIPVFNIKKDDVITRLAEYISTLLKTP